MNEWQKIKNGDAKIVIVQDLQLFAPAENIGIIIIDESHDSSYKSDMTPRYNDKRFSKIYLQAK